MLNLLAAHRGRTSGFVGYPNVQYCHAAPLILGGIGVALIGYMEPMLIGS